MDVPPGTGIDDLPTVYREGYLHAIESARADHDPATEWPAFREYLWIAVARVFGVEVTDRWPDDGSSESRERASPPSP